MQIFRQALMLAAAVLVAGTALAGQPLQGTLSNVRAVTDAQGERFERPRFSPDGKQIAYTQLGFSGLYVINSDGTQGRRLTDRLGAGVGYQWSADGTRILTRATRLVNNHPSGAPRVHSLEVISVADGRVERIGDEQVEMRLPAWRYDAKGRASVTLGKGVIRPAKEIVLKDFVPATGKTRAKARSLSGSVSTVGENYSVSFDTDNEHLWVIDADGNRTSIYDGYAFLPALSPDGRRVAFCDEKSQVRVINLDGSGLRTVGDGFSPAWANDSQLIVQRTTDDGHDYTSGDLYLLNLDGSAKALTNSADRIELDPSVSPDGKRIVFSDYKSGQIYTADIK